MKRGQRAPWRVHYEWGNGVHGAKVQGRRITVTVSYRQVPDERRCAFCQMTEDDDLGGVLASCDEHGYCCDACHEEKSMDRTPSSRASE